MARVVAEYDCDGEIDIRVIRRLASRSHLAILVLLCCAVGELRSGIFLCDDHSSKMPLVVSFICSRIFYV